jgi:hypothetical protein
MFLVVCYSLKLHDCPLVWPELSLLKANSEQPGTGIDSDLHLWNETVASIVDQSIRQNVTIEYDIFNEPNGLASSFSLFLSSRLKPTRATETTQSCTSVFGTLP